MDAFHQSPLINDLHNLAGLHQCRWSTDAEKDLRFKLFANLCNRSEAYFRFFFPNGPPSDSELWSLREAQGAVDGAEYLPSARGTACGHIFKSGESTYACKTCAVDDTCVLCTKCFESSDHEGHQVFISISPGNSGCCDCGDKEAWKKEVVCSIHSEHGHNHKAKEKASEPVNSSTSKLPQDLVSAVRSTIAQSLDFMCDVLSCSPEQMRLAKTEQSILQDEIHSRLSIHHADGSQDRHDDEHKEFALVLWNDEKHTVDDVRNQVARACKRTKRFGQEKAYEVNDIGRSVVHYSEDVNELLGMAAIIEQLKLTVTIRSSRETFREYMCAAIIDWISDISGCSVLDEHSLLRTIICEELVKPWSVGSEASNQFIGQQGIDDHETEDNYRTRKQYRNIFRANFAQPINVAIETVDVEEASDDLDNTNDEDDDDEDDDYEDDDDVDTQINEDDEMELDINELRNIVNGTATATADAGNVDFDSFMEDDNDVTEVMEAALAGYPAPPPPPQPSQARQRIFTPTESEDGEIERNGASLNAPFGAVPETPQIKTIHKRPTKPSRHWLEKPEAFKSPVSKDPSEDIWQRVRLDWLILYDLRLWKIFRINLRHLFITTVVVIPHFKRLIGLRFAGLYTPLAELYLIADREPDHSIINLSIQMLTTPSITEEVVERGNFLTNLMAILYTFLTTRQVGYPGEVNPKAVLAFDSGTVTNRRMFHFFMDLRWLLQSEYIQYRIKTEPHYLLQFLDLVKLHQGICPNVRATGDHVEYESDAWISASLIIKDIDKLCRQVAASFEPKQNDDNNLHLQRAIRTVAQVTLINSFGYERKRFAQAELKSHLVYHTISPLTDGSAFFKVPDHVVQTEPMSFHHPLHYLLSWLIEHGKSMSRDSMRALLRFVPADLKDPFNNIKNAPALAANVTSDQLLSAILDPPLRVCVWLAQTKAGMWVRNGITLRHQANSYRNVTNRDIGYQRDIVMVQAGLVLLGNAGEQQGEAFLAQIIDRIQMLAWMSGEYSIVQGFEESQQLDVIEDFFHLLVIALSERGNLVPDASEQAEWILRHDIAHALCFKPLSYSDLTSRVTEKVSESDNFDQVLQSMTNFRAPEGLQDTGVFDLKPEYIELIDPYFAHYTRNLREEAENVYKKHMSKKTGQRIEDVVYEPKLQSIDSGLFKDLAAFTRTKLFAQSIFAALNYSLGAKIIAPNVQATRIETFLHMILHLVLIAVIENSNDGQSFTALAILTTHKSFTGENTSIVKTLDALAETADYASCRATIRHVLRKMMELQPEVMTPFSGSSIYSDRSQNDSSTSISAEDREKKKQDALARQARVMAQMKQAQNSFLMNQGLNGLEDDFDDVDDAMSITADEGVEMHRKMWHFPTGTCILCQEATNDQRLYGTFAYLGDSNILRTTPTDHVEYVEEVLHMPESLDRAYTDRPFGVARLNRAPIEKTNSDGMVTISVRQGLSEGFPQAQHSIHGPVSTSCGHIMHYSCFELYCNATQRRHHQQIARNHPEIVEKKEFICPLCKALGNTFLPIVWKSKECAMEQELVARDFGEWLSEASSQHATQIKNEGDEAKPETAQLKQRSDAYVNSMFTPNHITSMQELSISSPPSQSRYTLRRGYSISSLFRLNRAELLQTTGLQDSGQQTSPVSETQSRTNELVKAYARAGETIKTNELVIPDASEDEATSTALVLSRALALTVSSIEIANRGVESGNTSFESAGQGSLLAELSESTTTHLRVLSESIESYLAVSMQRPFDAGLLANGLTEKQKNFHDALLGSEGLEGPRTNFSATPCLLEGDIFLFYADWLAIMNPSIAEARNVMQLCLAAELVKVMLAFRRIGENDHFQPHEQVHAPLEMIQAMAYIDDVYIAIQERLDVRENARTRHSAWSHRLIRQLCERYALTFLRKCLLLLHTRFGIAFEGAAELDRDVPELQRLLTLLKLPTIDALIGEISLSSSMIGDLTRCWIQHLLCLCATSRDYSSAESTIKVSHPAILELVGLPKNYDILTEEAIKRKCPTTGKELTDPACCLFCGAIFCSQAVCCMKDNVRGGCWQHMQECSRGNVGIYINIRKCMVLFMHARNGSYLQAPYLDRHGEPDPTLRRHHPLYLNQRRYDKLIREVWLQHGIQNVISRKLEADINPGGWETL